MTDFVQKIEANPNVQTTTVAAAQTLPAHEHEIVENGRGHKLKLKLSQIPVMNTLRNSNLWRYSAKSDLSQLVSQGGQAFIQIDRNSGSGNACEASLRFVITNNTGASCRLCDMAHFISDIQFTTPSGAEIQRFYSQDIWSL